MSAHKKLKRERADRLWQFIVAIDNNEIPPHEIKMEGLAAVQEVMESLLAAQGRKKPSLTVDTPQFAVAMSYARGEINYGDAWKEVCDICNVEESAAKGYLKAMKENAKSTAKFFDQFEAAARILSGTEKT